MEQSLLDIHTPKKDEAEQKLPFSLKAKFLAFQKGIPYSQAFREILDQEIKENKEEREINHAP